MLAFPPEIMTTTHPQADKKMRVDFSSWYKKKKKPRLIWKRERMEDKRSREVY